MPDWLQKFTAQMPKSKASGLPATMRRNSSGVQTSGQSLPPASVVYGIAAAALFAVALCFLFAGSWFTGILVLLPAGCFLGYSLHFLKIGA
jgi:hypothetical protein